MKKIKFLIVSTLLSSAVFSQPIGNPPSPATVPNHANSAWYRGGNNIGGTNPVGANIFGTMWNSPIYTYTNGVGRMIVNGTKSPTILNATPNTSGYVGIGDFGPASVLANPNIGPFTLLHLEGRNNVAGITGAWRTWMQTGMYVRDQTDAMYIGLKDEGNNLGDAVIGWSDDASSPAGPDKLRFIFSRATGSAVGLSLNPRDGFGQNGYEFMRMVASDYQTNSTNYPAGFIGVGPIFTNNLMPKSRIHMYSEDALETWLQIGNEGFTGPTEDDGLRFGIIGENNASAYIRWQENTPFIIQTDWNNNPGGIANGERVRISSINAPGVTNPGLAPNTTRVAISIAGNNPITDPRSLVHLGANVPFGDGGWRPWMNIGTYTTNGGDNMYVGLKQEGGPERQDAIINWGDNDGNNPANAPDNLRFIFTARSFGPNAPANTGNGLEVARFIPQLASTIVAPNFGMMGIGDYSPGGPNVGLPVDAKLDIDGDLRIRQVTQDDNLTQILVIDPNDLNRVHWRDASNLGGFGSPCGSATPLQLTSDNEVRLNTFNFHFSDNGGTKFQNNVGLGTNCQINLAGKLHVYRTTVDLGTTGAYILNSDATNPTTSSSLGLFVKASAMDAPFTTCRSVAGWFETVSDAAGETGYALYVPDQGGRISFGFGLPNFQPDNQEPEVCGQVTTSDLMAVNGNIFTTGTVVPSDINFKTNIAPISDAISKVKKLNGVYYDYIPNSVLHFSTARQVGLIAQNVDTVLTEVTNYDSTLQAFTLDYSKINALLIEAIKEQDARMDSMENEIAELKSCINQANLCGNSNKTSNGDNNSNSGQSIELKNANAIILDQNLPNPFAEHTTITYNIPVDISEAVLMFYDMNGRIMNQVVITERGESNMTVYGDNLRNGIYTYSLIADGQLIATKKMVKQ